MLGPRALRPPQPSLPWTLPLLLFRVRPTSRGSHHPGKGCCDLHPSPWVCRGSTPRRGGLGVSACGRGRWPREGTGREGKGALQPPQEAPGSSELNSICHLQAPCRLPARPPSRVGCPHWWSWVLGSGRGPAPAPGFHRVPRPTPVPACDAVAGFVVDEPVSCSCTRPPPGGEAGPLRLTLSALRTWSENLVPDVTRCHSADPGDPCPRFQNGLPCCLDRRRLGFSGAPRQDRLEVR